MRISNFVSAILFVTTSSALYLGACNGNIKLCSRPYSNITQIGTHNSAFTGYANLGSNQHRSVYEQLNAGIRFLQSQTHWYLGNIYMCHTNCLIYQQGKLRDYLKQVNKWIRGPGNQQQVVTLLITNEDGVDMTKFHDAFKSFGLDQLAYVPPKHLALDEWPTLQELIEAGKRLIVFMDYHSDESKVPYILSQFDYYFETPHGLTDRSFNHADGRMYLVNHSLNKKILGDVLISDHDASSNVNRHEDIEKHANLCSNMYGRNPNVILVDFFHKGDVFKAQAQLNNL